ncbi:MAG: exodeoxyribonuclease VII large subunit, partial [Thermoguttaceae bacterium]
PHGKYQMIVSQLEPQGIGALELAFRQLRAKLETAGLFDPAKKRPLPKVVRTVAVITSPTGAAVRDFLQVLGRRTKRVDVRIVPVKVQGEGAAEEIAAAIQLVNLTKLADCIVVTRGGGSLEDLWAFNEEPLVRAVAASEIPTISAVGHEIDVSLCDLAADLRALTPSEAAERIAPEDTQIKLLLAQTRQRMDNSVERKLRLVQERFRAVEKHTVFLRPARIIEDRIKTVDSLEQNLDKSINRKLEIAKERFGKLAATLEALSPLAVFKRGYSITQTETGEIIRSAETVKQGDIIRTRLADGTITSVANS